MKNSVEAIVIILMMMILETVSDSGIACVQNYGVSCYEHTLSCTGNQVIWIENATYGYRSCGSYSYQDCFSPCCQYRELDCLVPFSDSDFRELRSNCSLQNKCVFTKYNVKNSYKCKQKDIYFNLYSKIYYYCVTLPPNIIIPSTIMVPSSSTSAASSSINESTTATHTLAAVPSVNYNDSTTTIGPLKVAGTTMKSDTDKHSNRQSSVKAGVIGGTVSGVIVLIILVMVSLYLIKRRRQNTKQVSNGDMPSRVSQGVSAPITFHKNTDPTVVIGQQNGGRSNSTGYEVVDLETSDDFQAAGGNAYYQLEGNSKNVHSRLDIGDYDHIGADNSKSAHSPLDGSDYDHIGADNSKISHPRLDKNDFDHVGADNSKTSHSRLDRRDYDHLGEEHFQNSSLDMGDYDHIPDVGNYGDNYHHIGTDDFKKRETNMADCDYSHIQTAPENKNEPV